MSGLEPRTAPAQRRRAPRMAPAERYAQLLEVAEAEFVARGYAAVSMEDIARAAGVTRPVVYDHFGTKERAYIACVERARASYEQQLLQNLGSDPSPQAQLQRGAEAFFAMLEEDPARWKLLFGGAAVPPGEASDELARLRFGTIEQIRLALAASAPNAPADRIEVLAHVASGAGERLGHWWLTRPDLPRATLVAYFVDAVMDGLRPYAD